MNQGGSVATCSNSWAPGPAAICGMLIEQIKTEPKTAARI